MKFHISIPLGNTGKFLIAKLKTRYTIKVNEKPYQFVKRALGEDFEFTASDTNFHRILRDGYKVKWKGLISPTTGERYRQPHRIKKAMQTLVEKGWEIQKEVEDEVTYTFYVNYQRDTKSQIQAFRKTIRTKRKSSAEPPGVFVKRLVGENYY